MSKYFSEWNTRTQEILEETKKLLNASDVPEHKNLLKELPDIKNSDDKPLTIVFAGQYSAGKSSLIKALTGCQNIKIGEGIVTDSVTEYDWKGITIIDTPGIRTGSPSHADHDEKAFDAIARADLLIYLTTNNLFDPNLIKDFRNLAFEKGKAHEMMLVVNKMESEAEGNSEAVQKAKLEDLKKDLSPFLPEDFYVSFISLEDFFESQKPDMPKSLAAIKQKKSGMETLNKNISRFIHDKNLIARYTTPLYTICNVIEKALSFASSGDEASKGLEDLLNRKKSELMQAAREIKEAVSRAKNAPKAEANRQSRRMIAGLDSGNSRGLQAAAQSAEAAINNAMRKSSEQLSKEIGSIISEKSESIAKIFNTRYAKDIEAEIIQKFGSMIPEEYVESGKSVAKNLKNAGDFLIEIMTRDKTAAGLKIVKNSTGHQAIIDLGHLFGMKFRPYQALKWANNARLIGQGLSLAGSVIETFAVFAEEKAEAKRREAEARARESVYRHFTDINNVIDTEFDEAEKCYTSENIKPELEKISAQLKELRSVQTKRKASFADLEKLLNRTNNLINEIQTENKQSAA